MAEIRRILVLDDNATKMLGVYNQEGIKVDTEYELFGAGVAYKSSPKQLRWLASLTEKSYDLIIIGNNQRIGEKKAQSIPEPLRARCVVVWFDPPTTHDTKKYRGMGYKHFTIRDDLEKYLIEHLSEF